MKCLSSAEGNVLAYTRFQGRSSRTVCHRFPMSRNSLYNRVLFVMAGSVSPTGSFLCGILLDTVTHNATKIHPTWVYFCVSGTRWLPPRSRKPNFPVATWEQPKSDSSLFASLIKCCKCDIWAPLGRATLTSCGSGSRATWFFRKHRGSHFLAVAEIDCQRHPRFVTTPHFSSESAIELCCFVSDND